MTLLKETCVPTQSYNERESLVKKVRQWGDLNTDAVLDLERLIFSIPTVNGFIGYKIKENCAVVFGAPVCSVVDRLSLNEAFQDYCNQHHLNVIYNMISDSFTKNENTEKAPILVPFGYKLSFDPKESPQDKTGSKAVLVRKKVKRALKEGVLIEEYLVEDKTIEENIEKIGKNWLSLRRGPQIYIAHLSFFNDREGKRWFYAKYREELVGFLILNETKETGGWLLNNLIVTSQAPNGTAELLVIHTLEALNKEGVSKVIVGPVTGSTIPHVIGLSSFSTIFLRLLFKCAKIFLRLDGQAIFWDKFQPDKEPSYILFDTLNYRTIKGLLRAMNFKVFRKKIGVLKNS